MATWQEFVDFASEEFPILVVNGKAIRIDIKWNDGRSHWARATHISLDDPLVWIWSPLCEIHESTAEKVLQAQKEQSSFIGVIQFDDGYALSTVLDLPNFNRQGAARIIRMITELADEIEKDLMGGQDGFTANIAPQGGGSDQGGAGFCIQCGAARVPGGVFCSGCGARLG